MQPDVKTVAVSRVDGGLTVLSIIEKEYDKNGVVVNSYDITPEYVESIIAKHIESGNWKDGRMPVSWEFVSNDYVDEKTDRSYRNAWKHVPGGRKPDHDMTKAKEIQRVRLRKERLAEFCRLDKDFEIAEDASDQKAKKDISTMRQKFRDVTEDPRIEAAQTVEELKTLSLKTLIPETVGKNYMNEKMRFQP